MKTVAFDSLKLNIWTGHLLQEKSHTFVYKKRALLITLRFLNLQQGKALLVILRSLRPINVKHNV